MAHIEVLEVLEKTQGVQVIVGDRRCGARKTHGSQVGGQTEPAELQRGYSVRNGHHFAPHAPRARSTGNLGDTQKILHESCTCVSARVICVLKRAGYVWV